MVLLDGQEFLNFEHIPANLHLFYSACVPTGLIRSFPENALQLMILSGAKGTMVNSVQVIFCIWKQFQR